MIPAGPGSGAPVGSGGRPGVSRGSSAAEALTTRLEPRTGLVREGRPGLGKRRRGWISWWQRVPVWYVLGSLCHSPSLLPRVPCATHVAKQLVGQTQVVVKCQKGDPLQPHHDDLRGCGQRGQGQGEKEKRYWGDQNQMTGSGRKLGLGIKGVGCRESQGWEQ